MYTQQLLIRETHLDCLGHVNNATYLQIFEEVRWDMLVGNGFGIPEISSSKTGPVILECTIKFKKELKARDTVTATVEVLDYKDKVGKLRQQLIKADGSVSCEADFIFALFDLQNRKLLLPSPQWLRAIGLSKPST